MTDSVFLFGSFTQDEANAFQSSSVVESSAAKRIQSSSTKTVKQNGFGLQKAPVVVKQNGNLAPPSKGANNNVNGRATGANGKAAAQTAVDALAQPLGQVPPRKQQQPASAAVNASIKPGIAVPVGAAKSPKSPKSTGGGSNNVGRQPTLKPSKTSNQVSNGSAQPNTKVSGGAPAVNSKSIARTASPPAGNAVVVSDGNGELQQSPVLVPVGAPPLSGTGGDDSTTDGAAAAPANVAHSDENGEQADWFMVNSLHISGENNVVEKRGERDAANNNGQGDDTVKDDTGEQKAVLPVVPGPEMEAAEKNNGFSGTGDDDSESVPSKLLPKSWAALVGTPGESKPGNNQSSELKGKGTGPAAQTGSQKSRPVAVPPVTALSGETWLRSLREAEVSGRRLQPKGLINTGNSCFLNSTLQAMLSCSAFTHLLQVLKARSVPQSGYPTLRAFFDFSVEFEAAPARSSAKPRRDGEAKALGAIDVGKPFAPAMFDPVLQSFTPDQPPRGTGGRNRQEDAQEFLSFVVDKMHEEILRLEGRDSARALSVSALTSAEDEDWEMVGPKNRSAVTRTHTFSESAVTDIFGGQLRSVVKTKGNKASATVQPFLILHLDIVPEVVHSVEDALRFFAAPESLEGYKPPSAKVGEVVSASKSVKIQNLPRVLILHLMRFSYGSGGSSKLHKPVQFPLELMLGRELLSSTTTAGNEIRKYELVATVSHHGKDPSVGHYTSDSKQASGQWLRFDDGVVSGVVPNRVLQEQAYVLFYKRAGF